MTQARNCRVPDSASAKSVGVAGYGRQQRSLDTPAHNKEDIN